MGREVVKKATENVFSSQWQEASTYVSVSSDICY